MNPIKPHKHWTVVAYDKELKASRQYEYPVQIHILNASNEDSALKQAMAMIRRKHYRVMDIRECSSCMMEMMAQTFMKKQEKLIDKELGEDEEDDDPMPEFVIAPEPPKK